MSGPALVQCNEFDSGSGARCSLYKDHIGPHTVARRVLPPGAENGTLRSIIRHRDFIRQALNAVAHELEQRWIVHDLSKLLSDEFEGFSRIGTNRPQFGSLGYAERMSSEQETILRHYSRNSHHPEHGAMTFIDIIEMVSDWWAAGKGYGNEMEWDEAVQRNMASKGHLLEHWQISMAYDVARFLARKLD